MCEKLAAKLEQPQLLVPKGKCLNPKRVEMKPFAKERWCTENKWKPIRKFKKPVMSFVGCVYQTWRALHFINRNWSLFQQPCKFFKLLLRCSRGCPIAWFKVRLLIFQTSSIQFSDIVDDLAIASTFGVHVVDQALDPKYVFLFKLRAATLLTLSTTLGLHLDSCTMWFYFFWFIQT